MGRPWPQVPLLLLPTMPTMVTEIRRKPEFPQRAGRDTHTHLVTTCRLPDHEFTLSQPCRDSLSQGVPFVFSRTVESLVFDPIWQRAFSKDTSGSSDGGVKRAVSVFSTSVVATFMSQGLHNCQIRMQAEQSLSYSGVLRTLQAEHGVGFLYKGGSARVGLLLVVNGLNEMLLKPAWELIDD